jgi:hypothetical protein
MNTLNSKLVHDKRFRQWQSRVHSKTKKLADMVVADWVPLVESAGFKRVAVSYGRTDLPVEGSCIQLERTGDHFIDIVYLFFDKYGSPRFQVGASRRLGANPDQIVRSAHFVKNASEFYHEWGKPRWWPISLWTRKCNETTVKNVVASTAQLFRFLETGERGPMISRASNARMPTRLVSGE